MSNGINLIGSLGFPFLLVFVFFLKISEAVEADVNAKSIVNFNAKSFRLIKVYSGCGGLLL